MKTDRRDAIRLARSLRMGDLVGVVPPDEEVEALRDVLRAREDAVHAQRRARQQLSSFLLRHDRKWPGKTTWTDKHLIWIRSQRFAIEAQQQVLADYVREVERQTQRLAEATTQVESLAPETKPCAQLYHYLQAVRGVGTITAATLVAELGDLRRFKTASRLMSYAGLVLSERSSGPRARRGAITKGGNPHVRWKLIEAAWHARHRPALSIKLRRRQAGVPQEITDIAWKAQAATSPLLGHDRARQAAADHRRRPGSRAGRLHLGHRPGRTAAHELSREAHSSSRTAATR